jgi:hypothetical protein
MLVVRPEISAGHVEQWLAKRLVLATVLHITTGCDVEEFAAPETFPGTGIIAAQHVDDVLAVKLHASKQVVFF